MAGVPHYRVGNLELFVVSDGTIYLDAGAVFGVVPRVLWEPVAGHPNEKNQLPLGLNCLVVRAGEQVVLIETGMGNKVPNRVRETAFPGDYGYLLDNLAKIGLRPEDVDIVINTHLHADHCGWNTVRRGELVLPTFPRARYYVQRDEWEDFLHPNERTRGSYWAENLAPAHEAGQLALVNGETQITPEVTVIPSPGHTRGHMSVVISAGGETAVYLGDVNQHPAQLERPAWVSAFDVLPLVSLETKRRLVEQAMAGNWLLFAVHHAFPGVGRLTEEEGRRRWTPEPPPA